MRQSIKLVETGLRELFTTGADGRGNSAVNRG